MFFDTKADGTTNLQNLAEVLGGWSGLQAVFRFVAKNCTEFADANITQPNLQSKK